MATGRATKDKWMVVADVDGTLLGDDHEFFCPLGACATAGILVVPNSSRPLTSLQRSFAQLGVEGFVAQVGALGTELDIAGALTAWSERFGDFDRSRIDQLMGSLGYPINGSEFQTPLKASYSVPREEWERVRMVLSAEPAVEVITSGRDDLDVIPAGAGKHAPLSHLGTVLQIPPHRIVAAGDTMNDLSMLVAVSHRIVVGNAEPDLARALAGRAVFSTRNFAAGIREGLDQLGVLS